MRKRRRSTDEEWHIDYAEVERLTKSLITNLGAEAAATAFEVFKRLDKGETVEIKNVEPRETRKKIRHLCVAFLLSPVDLDTVPGAKPVVLSFRKPSNCPVKLARCLKGYLKDAILVAHERGLLDAQETIVTEAEVEKHQERMQLYNDALATAGEVDVEGDKNDDVQDEPAPSPEDPSVMTGMMTLTEYRALKEKYGGRMPTTEYTREAQQEKRSLMELSQEGHFESAKDEVQKYMDEKSRQDFWGKSAAAQRRKVMEVNARANRRANRYMPDDEDSDAEPWSRFDREKLFESTGRRPATKEDMDRMLDLAAERKAGFRAGSA